MRQSIGNLSGRTQRLIDALHGRIEQLQERNRRLDAEADRLAEMVRFASAVDTTMLAPK